MRALPGHLWLFFPFVVPVYTPDGAPPRLLLDPSGKIVRKEPAVELPPGLPLEADEFLARKALCIYAGARVETYSGPRKFPGDDAAEIAWRRQDDDFQERFWSLRSHPIGRYLHDTFISELALSKQSLSAIGAKLIETYLLGMSREAHP